jgi:NADPH2:quinone reductase
MSREAMALRVHEPGGPDAMRWEEVTVPEPGAGQVVVRHVAIGVTFDDVHQRTGQQPVEGRPFVPGTEAVGVVEAIGPGVKEVTVGQRVAYAGEIGAYAEQRLVASARLVGLPDNLDDRTAAALFGKGLTARYLVKEVFRLKAGQRVLVHAAAGGVGLILAQWARYLGAQVIGTVGDVEKTSLAKANGCEHVILYRHVVVSERIRALTQGEGVDVVFDSVGAATWEESLRSIRPRGMMVAFGESSGPVPPVDIRIFGAHGSLYVTTPRLETYIYRRDDLFACAKDLFDVISRGVVRASIGASWSLRDAPEAHRALESRSTTGSTILLV